jgi:hypothetical protein
VLTHGSKTWVLSKSDETILGVFERKILRAIFGSTNENGEWRIKYNNEICTLYKESDTVTYNKINRLRWAGHVIRLEEQSAARRVLVAVAEGRRQRGRPKLRWQDGVMEDARKLGRETGGMLQGIGTAGGSFEQGFGSKWAVVPMMMMMTTFGTGKFNAGF